MGTISQVRLLLWKNWTVRKRQKMRFFMEIMWPVMLFIGLVWLRKANPLYRQHECDSRPVSMPAERLLNRVDECNARNSAEQPETRGERHDPAIEEVSEEEKPKLIRFWSDAQELLLNDPEFLHLGRVWRELSSMTKFIRAIRTHPEWIAGLGVTVEDILKDDEMLTSYLLRDVPLSESVVHQLVKAKIRPEQFVYGTPDLRLRDISCSQSLLERFLIFPSRHGVYAVHSALCPLKPSQLESIEEKFYADVDMFKLLPMVKTPVIPLLIYAAYFISQSCGSSAANSTFEELERLRNIIKSWEEVGPQLWDFFQSNIQLDVLRDILRNPSVMDYMDRGLKNTGLTIRHILNFLHTGSEEERERDMVQFDWRNIFNLTDRTLRMINQYGECLVLDKFVGLPDETQLTQKALDLIAEKKFWAGLVFVDTFSWTTKIPPHVKFKIRMDIDTVERTNKIKDSFIYLGAYFPQFMLTLSRCFPIFIVLAWVYSVSMMVKSVVLEKEMRLKETLKAMGVTNEVLWCAWFIDSFLVMAASTALLTAIIMGGKVLNYSNPIILFIFLLTFTTATIMQCFLMTVFFNKANLAAACSGILYFSFYLPHLACFTWQDRITKDMKIMASLMSQVAFGFGTEYLSRYEEQGLGLQWDNIHTSPLEGDEFSFHTSIIMMLLDTVLYAVLAWYLDSVFPGQYGIGRPFYFPIQPSYWLNLTNPTKAGECLNIQQFIDKRCSREQTTQPSEPPGTCKHGDRREKLEMQIKLEEEGSSYQNQSYLSGGKLQSQLTITIRGPILVIYSAPVNILLKYLFPKILLCIFSKNVCGFPGRTVILSTHHMDEADLLSDRVAIISQGRLHCCGSPLFLKSMLGAGFYLTLVRHMKDDTPPTRKEGQCDCKDDCSCKCSICTEYKESTCSQTKSTGRQMDGDVETITNLVHHHVPEARLVEAVGQELTFLLPSRGFKHRAYASLFRELEETLADIGLSSFGVSDTSLEEVSTSKELPNRQVSSLCSRLYLKSLITDRNLMNIVLICIILISYLTGFFSSAFLNIVNVNVLYSYITFTVIITKLYIFMYFCLSLTTSVDAVVAMCVIFAMSFVPASFVLYLIQERVTQAKHLQFVSGVSPLVYWTANFLWDMISYSVSAALVVQIFINFDKKCYTSPANLHALIALLMLYGWSVTPMMYPMSYVFSVPSTAYVSLSCLNLFIGINSSAITFILDLFDSSTVRKLQAKRGREDYSLDPFSWNFVGKNVVCMAAEGFIYFILNILIQYRFFLEHWMPDSKKPLIVDEDLDVAKERERIYRGGSSSDILHIRDLSKTYSGGTKPAVDRICVGVSPGECFGLLGVNGAGKTTTFKMLTGDIDVSSGEAAITGYSILTNILDVYHNMGYCPQFDAIDDLLTGREHLHLYARLRGVPESEISRVAEWGIQKLGLSQYAGYGAGTYSGGNKRKLSTAIAMIGCPALVLLVCNLLMCFQVLRSSKATLLNTDMEECEALCTRLAIMVNGIFKCLGTIQHLKYKFGDGYVVTVVEWINSIFLWV
uniref:ABC transporter domain-containing protein n=1 Tax=Astyanax mexicanus TaxID=7994 RepID=A0A8B9HSE8_ASTMX